MCVSVTVPPEEQKSYKSHIIHHALAMGEGWKVGLLDGWPASALTFPPETQTLTPVCVVLAIAWVCVSEEESGGGA